MLKFINLKKLTAKTLIGILMVGGLIAQSDNKAVASNGVRGIELNYQHSDFKCSRDGEQADIKVYVYDQDNNFLAELSKGEKFVSETVDSINDLKLRYQFNNVNCIALKDNDYNQYYHRYADEPNLNSYSSGEGWRQFNIPPALERLDPLAPGEQLPSYLSELGTYSDDQTSVSSLFQNLGSYEELLLVELATDNSDSSLYDLQDVVLVVDNNPDSLIPPDPSSNVVDVELVLAVDVSSSVDDGEFAIQRDGYVTAFGEQTIKDAIMALPKGIAVNMMFWTSERDEPGKVSVHDIGWYKLIKNGDEVDGLDEFVDRISNIQRSFDSDKLQTLDGINIQNGTDMALGIRKAQALLEDDVNGYVGTTKIIDISGDGLSDDTPITQTDIDYVQTYIDDNNLDIGNYLDGRNSCGRGHVGSKSLANEVDMQYVFCPPVLRARDTAINAGITINGLPINATSEDTNREDEVGDYYLYNALGGPNGAYSVDTIFNREQFAAAATQKILGEIDPTEKPNNAPTARDDFGETLVNQSVTIDVLANDFDINGDSISITGINSIVDANNNTVNLDKASYSGNNITFSHDTAGTYVITYEISDGSLKDTGKLTIEVFGYAD